MQLPPPGPQTKYTSTTNHTYVWTTTSTERKEGGNHFQYMPAIIIYICYTMYTCYCIFVWISRICLSFIIKLSILWLKSPHFFLLPSFLAPGNCNSMCFYFRWALKVESCNIFLLWLSYFCLAKCSPELPMWSQMAGLYF